MWDAPVYGSRVPRVYSRRVGCATASRSSRASPATDHSPAIDVSPPPSAEWGRRSFRFLRVGHSPYPPSVLSFPPSFGFSRVRVVGLVLPAGRVTSPIPLAAAMASEESTKVRGPPSGVPLLEEEEVEPAMDLSPDPPSAAPSSAVASGQRSGSSPVRSAAHSAVGPGHGEGLAASGSLLPTRPGEGARAVRAALVAAQVETASARTTPPAPQGWWTPPPHPNGKRVGHLRDVYFAIPDARRLDA